MYYLEIVQNVNIWGFCQLCIVHALSVINVQLCGYVIGYILEHQRVSRVTIVSMFAENSGRFLVSIGGDRW